MATQLKLRPGISLDGLSSGARSMVDRILSTTDLGNLDVTSAHRNPFLNSKVGGAKGSQHIQGNAIDINVSGLNDDQKQQLLKSAIAAGAKGVGIYPSGNAIHLDTRQNPTLWGPGKNKYSGVPVEKAPAWAQPVLKQMFAGNTKVAQASNMGAADTAMKLTPQEKFLYERHLKNVTGGGGFTNADGSRSTLKQTTVGVDGKTYSIPTVYDGKEVSADEAFKRAKDIGLDKFPSYSSPAEAQKRYDEMHKYMERDIQGRSSPSSPQAPPAWAQPVLKQMFGGGKFNAEGGDYDMQTARATGMRQGPDGHWGSVAPPTNDTIRKYNLPDNSYIVLKGKTHPTFGLAVKAEEERGSKVIKLDDRYYSVPKSYVPPPSGSFGPAAPQAPPEIKNVIAEASAKFGVSEDLMTRIAARESSFNPGATNPKSSARGLYQFIDETWSGMVAKYGAAAGVAPDASRFDPKAAALMAAAMTKENDLIVQKIFGRPASPGELYVGHFMGGPKMVSMLQLNEKQPDAPAAVAFPAEAAANPTIFFNKAGEPQPVSAVYANLTNINTATGGSSVAAAPAGPKADFNFTPVKGATPAVQHASQGSVELESEVDRFGKRMGGRRMLG